METEVAHRNLYTSMDYYRALAEKSRTLTEIKDARPVNVGTAGGFPFYFRDKSNWFTELAWTYLNYRPTPSSTVPGEYLLGAELASTRYLTYLRDVQWLLSSADEQALEQGEIDHQEAAQMLVNDYERAFGEITDDELEAAGSRTKVGYILDVQIPIWADKPNFKFQTGNVDDLEEALPNRPSESDGILVALCEYINALEKYLPILNMQGAARGRRNQAIKNTENPTKENGGLRTVAPDGKTTKYRVAYQPSREPKAIRADLEKAAKSSVTITIKARHYQQGEASLEVDGRAGGVIGWGGLLAFGTSSASYSVDRFAASQVSIDIAITMRGLSWVQAAPALLSEDAKTGWFAPDILEEAVKNDGKDVTGYHLFHYPASEVAEFWMQQGLVLGCLPSIKVTYHAGRWNQAGEELRQSADLGVSLFGIPLTVAHNRYKKANFERSVDGKSFTLTIEPPSGSEVPNLTDHRAHVLGVQVHQPFKPQETPKVPESRRPDLAVELTTDPKGGPATDLKGEPDALTPA
ncbi:hypothetical protein AB0I60_01085 [Actinosynnema sp. NPDC050436]|uniref:hypothetical protein n=1 Tax=Actinosynnema sp. NPDC050436 TaxID=3155659 RepID=UPI0034048979